MYYVYRFLDDEENIIYVGKTTNIISRIKQHFGNNGHLPDDCYKVVDKVEYAELKTRTEMDIYEIYYINKWLPVFNIMDKNNEDFNMSLNDISWRVINLMELIIKPDADLDNTKNIKLKIEVLNKKYNKLENDINLLTRERNKLILDVDNSINTVQNKASKVQIVNQSSIYINDIINIYKYSNLKNLTFSAQMHTNGVLTGNFLVYCDENKIYLTDKCGSNNVSNEIYDLDTNTKPFIISLGMHLPYIANQEVSYEIHNTIYHRAS